MRGVSPKVNSGRAFTACEHMMHTSKRVFDYLSVLDPEQCVPISQMETEAARYQQHQEQPESNRSFDVISIE